MRDPNEVADELWGTYQDGDDVFLREACDLIRAQAAEIERLRWQLGKAKELVIGRSTRRP